MKSFAIIPCLSALLMLAAPSYADIPPTDVQISWNKGHDTYWVRNVEMATCYPLKDGAEKDSDTWLTFYGPFRCKMYHNGDCTPIPPNNYMKGGEVAYDTKWYWKPSFTTNDITQTVDGKVAAGFMCRNTWDSWVDGPYESIPPVPTVPEN